MVESEIMDNMEIRVGIVEDNGLLRYSLSSSLQAEGFDVIFALENGVQAIKEVAFGFQLISWFSSYIRSLTAVALINHESSG